MIAHPVRPDLTDDIPDLELLKPLGQMLRKINLSLQAGHRWRMHPTTPLKCWKVGHIWMTTEDALRDFVARRTSAGELRSVTAPAAMSASRRRKVERAHVEARSLMTVR